MSPSPLPCTPFLLYVYPWMPYPRSVTIYLSEKRIPESLIRIIPVADPPTNTISAALNVPPKPAGSLPILAIPQPPDSFENTQYLYIRQSLAIINYIEDLSTSSHLSPLFPNPNSQSLPSSAPNPFTSPALQSPPLHPPHPLARARDAEILSLATEVLALWNPLRMAGSALAGRAESSTATPNAAVASEIWSLIKKRLGYLDGFVGERFTAIKDGIEDKDEDKDKDKGNKRDLVFGCDGGKQPSISDIVLYSFLEFVDGFYRRDASVGFEHVGRFYRVFRGRESARRIGCEDFPEGEMKDKAGEWAEGVFDE